MKFMNFFLGPPPHFFFCVAFYSREPNKYLNWTMDGDYDY